MIERSLLECVVVRADSKGQFGLPVNRGIGRDPAVSRQPTTLSRWTGRNSKLTQTSCLFVKKIESSPSRLTNKRGSWTISVEVKPPFLIRLFSLLVEEGRRKANSVPTARQPWNAAITTPAIIYRAVRRRGIVVTLASGTRTGGSTAAPAQAEVGQQSQSHTSTSTITSEIQTNPHYKPRVHVQDDSL